MDAAVLHNAIAAVCPIVGVTIGSDSDRTTWRVDFASDATDAQKAAGLAALVAFDPNAPEPMRYISKRIVVERLSAAGKLAAAFAALGGPGALQYERWSASASVDTENPDVIKLLTAIGADLPTILAPTSSIKDI